MNLASMARIAGLAAALAAVTACDRTRGPFEALIGPLPSPDEFQVITHEPPVIPETYTLPEPQPGAPSPRAPNPNEAAVTALLGSGAARAAGGDAGAEPSAGEQVLLSSANAASASSEIRVQLEEEKRQAAANQPYEPPSLWQLLGFSSSEDEVDESDVIDPLVEAERLQAEGVATPVDPEAEARAAEEASKPEPKPLIFDRRPTNRLGPPPTPAY